MADQFIEISTGIFKKLKDLGNGNYAESVYVEGGISGSGASSNGVVYVIASDGKNIPVDSLNQVPGGDPFGTENGTSTVTVEYDGGTYVQTTTFGTKGIWSGTSEWVMQP